MELAFAIVLIAVVAVFVTVPLRARQGEEGPPDPVSTADPELAALEARKQAKYREIRDTELDRAQGKLTEADYRRQEAELRAEAISVLKQIDARTEAIEAEAPSDGAEAEGERPG